MRSTALTISLAAHHFLVCGSYLPLPLASCQARPPTRCSTRIRRWGTTVLFNRLRPTNLQSSFAVPTAASINTTTTPIVGTVRALLL